MTQTYGRKPVTINIALMIGSACLVACVIIQILAQVQFDSAEKLIVKYLWKAAENKLELAIKIDPSNSRYPARLGEFLFTQAGYKDNKIPLLKKAEGYYERAVRLNPRCAGYLTKLGQIKLSIFMEDPSNSGMVRSAFGDFRKAIEDDPNGFNTAYAVGYSGLAVWQRLTEGERAIVIDRLRYALKQKQWYSEYIYPRFLEETRNSALLEMIAPEVKVTQWVDLNKIESIKASAAKKTVSDTVSISAWEGTATDGKNTYENGNMYWSGTMYGAIFLPKGAANIRIEAKGSATNGVWPYMLVSLDGARIGAVYVDSAEFKEYPFAVDTGGGLKILGIAFTNDRCNDKEDRNLFIGNARIESR